jgi:hypothetical protein
VQFNVTFPGNANLPADHYVFKPQVALSSGTFFWLSTPAPPQFTGDLQAWIRNTSLDPDWLRIGTDIVGGSAANRYNMAFSLSGTTVPEPGTLSMALIGAIGLAILWRRQTTKCVGC